jgi:peptidoglycan hydrolase CwlO-like protein
MSDLENTLKKMGMVLEKLVQKVDELDKRVAKLEEKLQDKKFSSNDLKAQSAQPQSSTAPASNSGSGFGTSFLGSLAGAMAGMGLYNLLFNHNVSAAEFGHEIGLSDNEINSILENEMSEIDSKLEEIDSKLEEIDSKIDNVASEDIMNNDYYESYEEGLEENTDFFGGVDDFGDFGGDFDV